VRRCSCRPAARWNWWAGDIGLQSSTLVVAGAAAKLHAAGTLSLSDGAGVIANALAGQAGPALTLQAAALTIDGSNTGLATLALAGSSGSTGGMAIDVNGPVTLSRGASLLALNGSERAAAPLHLQAGSLAIDGGGQATVVGSAARGSGPAGDVTVQVQGALRRGRRRPAAQRVGLGRRHGHARRQCRQHRAVGRPAAAAHGHWQLGLRRAGGRHRRARRRRRGRALGRRHHLVQRGGAADAAPLTLDVGRLNVEGRGADGYGSSVVAMAAGSGRGAALTLRASDSVRVGPQGAGVDDHARQRRRRHAQRHRAAGRGHRQTAPTRPPSKACRAAAWRAGVVTCASTPAS
jgi:hypothetical protein